MSGDLHEKLVDESETKPPSEKSFGVTFAVVFALIGLFPLIHGGSVRLWSLGIAAVFLALAFLAPAALAAPNRLWMRFGLLLHRIVNPIMLGLMFGLIVVPISLLIRLTGGKLLSRQWEPGAESYWIRRDPPGPEPETMRNQY